MTAKKISELTELAEAPASGDWFAVVDVSAGETKKVAASNVGGGGTPTLAEVLAAGNDAGEEVILITGISGHNSVDRQAGNLAVDDGDVDGTAQVSGGQGLTSGTDGGNAELYGGTTTSASGGTLVVEGGHDDDGINGDGGDITLTPGAGAGTGRNGLVFLNLPTSDPGISGALFSLAGVVKVSP